MITAVDSSVVIDALTGHATHGPGAAAALRRAREQGTILACSIVWAEITALSDPVERVATDMAALGIEFSPISRAAATAAGVAWGRYRREGGPRVRMVADFLIAGHAMVDADVLLTRDRGFHRRYFASVPVVDPSRARR